MASIINTWCRIIDRLFGIEVDFREEEEMMKTIMSLDWEAIVFCAPLLIWSIKTGFIRS